MILEAAIYLATTHFECPEGAKQEERQTDRQTERKEMEMEMFYLPQVNGSSVFEISSSPGLPKQLTKKVVSLWQINASQSSSRFI